MKLEARSSNLEISGGTDAQAATDDFRRLRVEIHGAVQGVGFRPFVYRLAAELGLPGWVINDTEGVFIEVEGAEAALARFLDRLPAETPPRAIVQSLSSTWLPPVGYAQFEIRHSDSAGAKTALILPDVATCPDCLAELLDPGRPPPSLPVHQLHQLRPAVQHHRGAALRPAEHDHAPVHHVPRVPGRVRQPAGPAVSRAAERVPGLWAAADVVRTNDEGRTTKERCPTSSVVSPSPFVVDVAGR